ncbi:HAD family hydrolase [Cohaesibacter gelatinilyticus]|uniref:2-haloacid dehalogenase n=1 Tax=Cohaesibacter gelatinilyticus TaxID=372072 RepID=A0A285PHE9_9HYPH|nr:HAD family phosphatase [Cohaesibacter gelatinilyticus]SNZ20703.1 2-haloacid dehalogenase [Cohaesibacter gelatinilyticus]HAT86033.1 HAD family phosphatase [Hyphomicrobiales bacterium]
MSAPISAIIFDIGNVLIQWDMRLLYRKLFPDEEAINRFIDETDLWAWNLEQDRGRDWNTAEEELVARAPHYENEIRAFRSRWHEMVPGPVSGTVAIKESLKEQAVPLYAITNFASDTFIETQQRFPFLYEFEDIIVSGEERLIKPDKAIYNMLLQRNGLRAEECLFIDDSVANIEGARQVGLQTHHFIKPELLGQDLRTRGFPI